MGNTLAFRLASTAAMSHDEVGDALRVDPDALDFFLEEEGAVAATAWRLLLLMNSTSSS